MNLRRAGAAEPNQDAVDAVIEAYVAWREASAAVGVAYRRWSDAPSPEREAAFAGYLAALEREADSAAGYRWAIARVTRGWAGHDRGVAPIDEAA